MLRSFLNLVNNSAGADDSHTYCGHCGIPFSLLVRKHQCGGGCQRLFCSKCTLQVRLDGKMVVGGVLL